MKIAVGKSVSEKLVKFRSVFRIPKDKLLVVEISVLHGLFGKEKNNMEPDIS